MSYIKGAARDWSGGGTPPFAVWFSDVFDSPPYKQQRQNLETMSPMGNILFNLMVWSFTFEAIILFLERRLTS